MWQGDRRGGSVYGERFHYDEDRESSIFAFQPHIPLFSGFAPDQLLNYASYSYGVRAFADYHLRHSLKVRLSYNYDVSDIQPRTGATSDYFNYIPFENTFGANALNAVRTSTRTPSFTHGVWRRVRASLRPLYMGGEDDVRGFDSWSVSPVAYLPAMTSIDVLNNDGTPRMQETQNANGSVVSRNITEAIPIYRMMSVGGDTKVVGNLEYRIPLGGEWTLALLGDAGVNRVTFRDQLQLDPERIDELNTSYPTSGFGARPAIQPGTQKIRVSMGPELQYFLKPIHTPLRFYWAYNPRVFQGVLQPPTALDRSLFPNGATYQEAFNEFGAPVPFRERRWLARFAIGKTF